MKKQFGFTLIELMVVLAIAGVVMGVGIPKLSAFFQSGRMTTNTNALVGAFQIAKSEAIKRQGPVTVCRSADQVTCDLDAGNTWEDGFLVFFDANNDKIVNGTDIILRINAGAEDKLDPDNDTGSVTIRSDTTTNNEHQYITFTSRGHPKDGNALQSATYVLCDDRGIKSVEVDPANNPGVFKAAARGVVLSKSGKVRSMRDGTKLTALTCTPT